MKSLHFVPFHKRFFKPFATIIAAVIFTTAHASGTTAREAQKSTNPALLKSELKARTALRGDHEVVVAASNSSAADKAAADVVCTGRHDEQTLQKAINSLGLSGTVRLMTGTYMVDGFTTTDDGTFSYAIGIPSYEGQPKTCIKIEGNQSGHKTVYDTVTPTTGATIAVSKACYDALDYAKQYSVLACLKTRQAHLGVERLAINLPDNQKNIVCIDGARFEGIYVSRCELQATELNHYNRTQKPHKGADGCIAIRGCQGSNYSFEFYMEHVCVAGFGVGYAVGGEHFYGEYLGAVFCTRGFTFNSYKLESGVWVHPITLINCCDEAPCCYPLFGNNPDRQPIDIINFNMEHYPNYFAAGGKLATETTPGQWYGEIDYSIMNFEDGSSQWLKNDPEKAFWADGSGQNVHSRNNAQKQMCTSRERRTYAPNYMQQIWDTDQNKLVLCIDPAKKLWVDAMGNKVD